MRNSIIFNEPQIKGLQSGNITAFVVKNPKGLIRKHAPYQISQEIFVKEKFCFGCEVDGDTMEATNKKVLYFDTANNHEWYHENDENCTVAKFKPATHLLEKDARFRLKITGVKVVRCQDMYAVQKEQITGKPFDTIYWSAEIMAKYGTDFYEANSYMWYFTFQLIKL